MTDDAGTVPRRPVASTCPTTAAKCIKSPDDLGIWIISFEVRGEPLEDAVERLRAMGVKFFSDDLAESDLKGFAPMKAVIFEDPDGNLLELAQLPSKEEYLRIKQKREAQHSTK